MIWLILITVLYNKNIINLWIFFCTNYLKNNYPMNLISSKRLFCNMLLLKWWTYWALQSQSNSNGQKLMKPWTKQYGSKKTIIFDCIKIKLKQIKSNIWFLAAQGLNQLHNLIYYLIKFYLIILRRINLLRRRSIGMIYKVFIFQLRNISYKTINKSKKVYI